MITEHTYYVAAHRKVYGSKVEELSAFLYAIYMKHAPVGEDRPNPVDGCSLFVKDGETTVRLVVSGVPSTVTT